MQFMQFCCFNPIPWPHVGERPSEWPFPNRWFDPGYGHAYYRSQIAQLIFAEECGFDWIGLGEDHMTAYSLTPNPNLLLAILSYYTRTVKLAILGAPLPLLNPIRVAEECAMLDVISGGRLVVGFIRGVPQNWDAYGMDPTDSRSRFEEASQLVIRAWTEPAVFAWKGAHYDFPKVSVWPLPLQKPYPPLVYSANSPESAVVGAKQRAMIGTIHLYNRDALEQIDRNISAYKDQARSDGWEPSPDRFLIGLPTCIAETDEEAYCLLEPALHYQFHVLSGTYDKKKRELAKRGLASPVEEDPPSLAERLDRRIVLCGSPNTVTKQINYLRDKLGVGIVSMHFQVGNMHDVAVRQGMRLFRDGVLPYFR